MKKMFNTNHNDYDIIFMKVGSVGEAYSELLSRVGKVSVKLAGGPQEETTEL